MNVGVLASGSGTNLQSLIDAAARSELGPARLTAVGVNVPGCRALGRAQAAGLDAFVVDHQAFPERGEFDRALSGELARRKVELVVLAGFMRLLGGEFLASFRDRIINIHPALLPSFPGVHAQKQAFQYGVKFTGCTVHFVDGGIDSGPIIAQTVVPVLEEDDEEILAARILAEEHRLLPAVVRAMAEGRISADGRWIKVAGAGAAQGALRSF